MTIKRMLLLLSAMAAFVAFAAPAAQANPEWYNEGVTIAGSETVEASGPITSEALGGAFKTPAEVDFHMFLSNPEGHAHGVIDEATITVAEGGNPTNLPGCSLVAGTTTASPENPWTVTTATTDPEVTIDNVTFQNHYSSGCAAFGVPSTTAAAGQVTGTVEGECIVLNKSGDLKNEANAQPVTLTGEVCLPGITLE